MKITQEGGEYHIAANFELELEETNAFLSDKGSQSLPVKLPYSEHNLSLLDRPERLARRNKYKSEHQVTITSGVFRKSGRQVVFSASKGEGISTTFYLKEGEFYSKIKDVKLSEIDWGGIRDPYNGSHVEKATAWLNHFTKVMTGEVMDDYCIFPVCTKAENEKYELLNEPDVTGTANTFPLLGYQQRTIGHIKCPVGYGVTPFLKIHRVFDYIFRHFGYAIKNNPFSSGELAEIVLLNNVADTICAGKLDYAQLVPDTSVAEFLDIFRNKFGYEFIIDSDAAIVNIRLLCDALNSPPDMDISPYIVSEPVISYEDFHRLQLSAGTGIDFAEPAAESMEMLFDNYPFISAVNEVTFNDSTAMAREQVVLRNAEGQYYRIEMDNNNVVAIRMGSTLFNYNRPGTLLPESREANDEQVALIIIKKLQEKTLHQEMMIPFIGERRHVNTGIKSVDGVQQEKATGGKTMLCFSIGKAIDGKWYMGTPFCFDNKGNKRGNLSLQYCGENGLFNRYWREYDAVLRHAFQKVTVKLNMPVSNFMRFNINMPKLIQGTPVFPVSINYSIGVNGLRIREAQFRTLRLLEPYNLEEEQAVPSFSSSPYYWERCNNIEEVLPAYSSYEEYIYRLLSVPPVARSYAPPTAAEFNAGGKYYVESYSIEITTYEMDYGVERNHHTYNDVYLSWLEPRKR